MAGRLRGGERVVEALCEMFPEADVFTHVYDPAATSNSIRSHSVRETFIARIPCAHRLRRKLIPLMPLALERLNLRDYDIILSHHAGPAFGVIPAPGALHICYCSSPLRYAWDMQDEYLGSSGTLTRALMIPVLHYLRMWEASSSARVDHFVCNSRFVAERVRAYYRRDAEIIPPPVATRKFCPGRLREDFFLMAGELVPYKRTDLAIRVFNRLGRRLVIIGSGPELARLRRLAAPNVTLLGHQPLEVLASHYARCRALIFPGLEDFGIVPVEAMAAGCPVIAYGLGGALDYVIDGVTGVLFGEQTEGSLSRAIERFESLQFEPSRLRHHALEFDRASFKRRMYAVVEREYERRHAVWNVLPVRNERLDMALTGT